MALPVTFVDGDTGGTPLSAGNLNSNFNYLEDEIGEVGITSEDLTLLTSGWVENQTTGYYEYTITKSGVTTSTQVNLYLDIENQQKLTGYAQTISSNGSFKIITNELPSEAISCTATYTSVNEVS